MSSTGAAVAVFLRRKQMKMPMRIKSAMTATPPTTPPAMAPGLILLEAATTVDDDAALVDDDVASVDDDAASVDDDAASVDDDGALDDGDMELIVEVALVPEGDKNGAATRGFESRKPAVKSPAGQPLGLAHGLDLQQPMNGGSVNPQVYHRLPEGHCWSGNLP